MKLILENIQVRIFNVISVKPVLPNGTCEVSYEDGNAVLKWSKPIGDYTRQVIEQWTNKYRQRREAKTECEKPQCVEHEVDKDQTTLTIPVEHQEYIFILVLYDGDVPVSAYRAKKEGTVLGL